MLVTKQFPLYFKQTYIVLFLPYHRTKSVVTNILQNIFFYVPQNTVIQVTGQTMTEYSFLGGSVCIYFLNVFFQFLFR